MEIANQPLGNAQSGFSYETVIKRWPIILTQVIDRVYRTNHELSSTIDYDPHIIAQIEEGKTIIEKISRLKHGMSRNYVMEPLINDGEAHVDAYNSELARLAKRSKDTWFTAPWLFAECYLYRLIRSYFSISNHWRTYDPFLASKLDVFKKSNISVHQIAETMLELENCETIEPNKLRMLFNELMQMCLWGNATDLSLLTELSSSDIESIQPVRKDVQESRQKRILRDDSENVWNTVMSLRAARIDFILDNAGFELFTDLVFADFLVTYTPYFSQAVFHPKHIPWFVSDVTPPDFASTMTFLSDTCFFEPSPTEAGHSTGCLERLTMRWKKYVENGTFSLSVPVDTPLGGNKEPTFADFWTAPYPYWDMKEHARDLWEWLSGSGLVIFKGDLNYRKLTGDVRWPACTPFQSAIGPLAGSFPLLSLRTCKADVVVGIDQETANHLDRNEEKWRVNGRYALISFSPASGTSYI